MVSIKNSIESIAIGSFDGMHVAHRELIALAEHVVVIEHEHGSLTPGYKRSWYTERSLAFYLLEEIRDLSAEEFFERLLRDYPKLKKIVVGYDFRFGREKRGTPELLERLFDGEVVVVGEITVGGVSVHARTIREFLSRGNLAMANRLLGRFYMIDGELVRGQGLGSRELVPTLNLEVEGYRLPAEGVYAGRTEVNGEWFPSVSFIGHRETTGGGFAVETHIIGREITEVSGRVQIEFRHFLRKNRRFGSFEALKSQIGKDIEEAEKLLNP